MIYHGRLAREITITHKIKVPLYAIHSETKPRFDRYQIGRRGHIAKLLKPKRVVR
jgi:hypothetical protein